MGIYMKTDLSRVCVMHANPCTHADTPRLFQMVVEFVLRQLSNSHLYFVVVPTNTLKSKYLNATEPF